MCHADCLYCTRPEEGNDPGQDTMRYPRDMPRQPAKPACFRDKFLPSEGETARIRQTAVCPESPLLVGHVVLDKAAGSRRRRRTSRSRVRP